MYVRRPLKTMKNIRLEAEVKEANHGSHMHIDNISARLFGPAATLSNARIFRVIFYLHF